MRRTGAFLAPSFGTTAAPAVPLRVGRGRFRSSETAPGPSAVGHDFSQVRPRAASQAGTPKTIEGEADRAAEDVVRGIAVREPISEASSLQGRVQKEEVNEGERKPPVEADPGPGSLPLGIDPGRDDKARAALEKLGAGVGMQVMKALGRQPDVKALLAAIDRWTRNPTVQRVLEGLFASGTAAAIAIRAATRAGETAPLTKPADPTMFGIGGTWDMLSKPKDPKLQTPIGVLPPDLRDKKKAGVGSEVSHLRDEAETWAPKEDLIGRRLREAREKKVAEDWVTANQSALNQDLEEEGRKKEERKAAPMPTPLFKKTSEEDASREKVADAAALGRGTPSRALDPGVRDLLEHRFGWDFSSVRIHTGRRAQASCGLLSARAFTMGEDVVFGSGEYRPSAPEGLKLLAHELTHVVQQARGAAAGGSGASGAAAAAQVSSGDHSFRGLPVSAAPAGVGS